LRSSAGRVKEKVEFMKITRLLTLLVVAILFSRGLLLQARSLPSRSVLSADADWRFFFGDQAGAESATFDDGTWHVVTIPHDWSIERPPAKENPSGSSGAICLPGSAGTERHLQRHLLGLANE
jgi:hypothetical protein